MAKRKTNSYIILDNKTAKILLPKGNYALIDIEDIGKCKPIYWMMNNRGYIVANVGKPRKHISMHRLLTDVTNEFVIDHINRVKYDNRKENLRICRQIDNCQNKINRRNKVSGVSFEIKSKKWFVYIGYKGKKISLGRYENYNEAVEVRKKAENDLYGGVICI